MITAAKTIVCALLVTLSSCKVSSFRWDGEWWNDMPEDKFERKNQFLSYPGRNFYHKDYEQQLLIFCDPEKIKSLRSLIICDTFEFHPDSALRAEVAKKSGYSFGTTCFSNKYRLNGGRYIIQMIDDGFTGCLVLGNDRKKTWNCYILYINNESPDRIFVEDFLKLIKPYCTKKQFFYLEYRIKLCVLMNQKRFPVYY